MVHWAAAGWAMSSMAMDSAENEGAGPDSDGGRGGSDALAVPRSGVGPSASQVGIAQYPEAFSTADLRREMAACPCCGSTVPVGSAALKQERRWPTAGQFGWWLFTGLGLILAWAGVYVATRTLPRFVGMRDAFHLDLPGETEWILRNGWVQPLPGCLLAVVGLTGLLSRRARPGLAGFGVLVVMGGVVLLVLTWLSLLVPPLVYT